MYQIFKRLQFKFTFFILIFAFLIAGCNSEEFQKVEINQFVGTWELKGRSMFEGVQIEIIQNKQNKFSGKIVDLNDNKYIEMFSALDDTWVTGISRISNYEFKLTEKKLGSALFSLYDLATTKDFKAQFIDENTIGLSAGNAKPSNSSIRYVRVNADNYGNKTN